MLWISKSQKWRSAPGTLPRAGWAGGLILAFALLARAGALAAAEVEFERLPLDGATTFALSDDGGTLAVAQEALNQVSLWDIRTAKVVRKLEVASPRSMLWRGNKLIVANYGKASITVFSNNFKGRGVRIPIPEPDVFYLSAPYGKNFSGLVIASCSVDEEKYDSSFFAVNVTQAKVTALGKDFGWIASMDNTGKSLITQSSPNLSPSCTIRGVYEIRGASASKITRVHAQGNHESTPTLFQAGPSMIWFGGNSLYSGAAPKKYGDDRGLMVIPDAFDRVFYMLDKARIHCVSLESSLTDIGAHEIVYPGEFKRFSKDRHPASREHEDNIIYQPIAVTVDGELHLFVRDDEHPHLYHCHLEGFRIPKSLAATTRPKARDFAKDAPDDADEPPKDEESPAPDITAEKPKIKPKTTDAAVPLEAIEALAKVKTTKLSTKELTRKYMDAVVVVRAADDATGTGIVIGSSGYVLTCAHVLSPSGKVSIKYRVPGTDGKETAGAFGVAVRVDEKNDLALLKIEAKHKLATAVLGIDVVVEAGEDVTVIGNPGVGQIVLAHSITTGVVSNVLRKIEGHELMQISAGVNPGCSGGPLFDDQGRVIGVVVAKANLESTSFAIPASKVGKFLGVAEKKGEKAAAKPNATATPKSPDKPEAGKGPAEKPAKPVVAREPSKMRTWTRADDDFEIEARIVEFKNGKVTLQRTNGKKIEIAIEQLSKEDQEFAKSWAGGK